MEIGTTVYSGNTMNPTVSTVVAFLTWDELTAAEKRTARAILDDGKAAYVRLRTPRCVRKVGALSLEVFAATHYATPEAMAAAYAAKAAA